jgi:hypothetical protein
MWSRRKTSIMTTLNEVLSVSLTKYHRRPFCVLCRTLSSVFIFIQSQDGDLKVKDFHRSPIRVSASLPFLNFGTKGDGEVHAPAALPPGKMVPPYQFYRRLGGLQNRSAGSSEEKKFMPLWGINSVPSAIQPVASHYIDCVIPDLVRMRRGREKSPPLRGT